MKRSIFFITVVGVLVLFFGAMFLFPNLGTTAHATDIYSSKPKFELGQCVQYKADSAFTSWGSDNTTYNQLPVRDYQEFKGTYKYAVEAGGDTWEAIESELEPCTQERKQQ